MNILIFKNASLQTIHLLPTSKAEQQVQQWWVKKQDTPLPPITVVMLIDSLWCECYHGTNMNSYHQRLALLDDAEATTELLALIQSL